MHSRSLLRNIPKVCPVFYFEAAEPLSAFSKELKRTKDRFETYTETKNKLHYSGSVPRISPEFQNFLLMQPAHIITPSIGDKADMGGS